MNDKYYKLLGKIKYTLVINNNYKILTAINKPSLILTLFISRLFLFVLILFLRFS
jgi:hypothetical protein